MTPTLPPPLEYIAPDTGVYQHLGATATLLTQVAPTDLDRTTCAADVLAAVMRGSKTGAGDVRFGDRRPWHHPRNSELEPVWANVVPVRSGPRTVATVRLSSGFAFVFVAHGDHVISVAHGERAPALGGLYLPRTETAGRPLARDVRGTLRVRYYESEAPSKVRLWLSQGFTATATGPEPWPGDDHTGWCRQPVTLDEGPLIGTLAIAPAVRAGYLIVTGPAGLPRQPRRR